MYELFPLFFLLLRLRLLLRVSYLGKDNKKSEQDNLRMGKYQFQEVPVR